MEATATPKLDRTMQLADGRTLAWSEWGAEARVSGEFLRTREPSDAADPRGERPPEDGPLSRPRAFPSRVGVRP